MEAAKQKAAGHSDEKAWQGCFSGLMR